MTEDRLKDLFHKTRPAADPSAKAAAIRAAMEAFEKEKSESLQGTAAPVRPTHRPRRLFGRNSGRRLMTLATLSMKPLLIGGTSGLAIATAVLVLNSEMAWTTREPIGKREQIAASEQRERAAVRARADAEPAATASRTTPPAAATPASDTSASPNGASAFTLASTLASSGITLAPGDRVDVILTRTVGGNLISGIIIQNLRVISDDPVAGTTTVEASTRERQQLTLAQQVGTLDLVLRAANDTQTAAIDPVDLGDIDFQTNKPRVNKPKFGTTVRVRRGFMHSERVEDTPEMKAEKRAKLEAERQRVAAELDKLAAGESVAVTNRAAPAENESLAIAPAAPPTAQQSFRRVTPTVGLRDDSIVRPAPIPVPDPLPTQFYKDEGRDKFAEIETNPPKVTTEHPVSTFSIDVDTASYAFTRKAIMQGVLPQPDAVRVEEMINYFPYDYAPPADRETPFATHVEIMPTPWNEATKLMRIGIKGYEIPATERPQANLVFLIDSSGSMNAPDKLPLLLNSFRLLLETLDGDDTVAIVAYAGSAGTVLEPTAASEKQKILAALGQLHAGGSTAGAEGIRQAYQLAESAFIKGGVNRVMLATDGDFNVGITDTEELKGFVERKRMSGVMLSVLGFGQGNLNDELMQVLAQNGNGSAAYIDTLSEARKALVEEAGSTLFPIAKDVKIQIEFNPATVSEYRLIGYETRMLAREDFNNDKIDAGEIGSGHSVTALYELTPAGSGAERIDDLRYGVAADAESEPGTRPIGDFADEFGFLKIRYKAPDGDVSKLIETPITRSLVTDDPGTETRFAAAVAAFGQQLRGGTYTGDFSYDDTVALAQGAKGPDPFGYRAEFVNLVRLAESAAAMQIPR